MPAPVDIRQWYGSGPTKNIITDELASFYMSDDPVGNPAPLYLDNTKPTGQFRYSYLLSTMLYTSVSPTTMINNIKWYGPGSYPSDWTGCNFYVNLSVTYAAATGTINVTASNNFGTNMTTYTSGSPLSVSGSISNPTTGDFGEFVQLQMSIAPGFSSGTATGIVAGTKSTITVHWAYDET
jgi:hypothetical protein